MINREAPRSIHALSILGLKLFGFQSASPLPVEQLYAGERRQYDILEQVHRRVEWLIGRYALRAAAEAAGFSGDSSRLSFPHAHLSLSHAPKIAIAVSIEQTCHKSIIGLGVDFERDRPMPTGMMRLFATENETALLKDRSDADVLRFWTIKEAVFKACPSNVGLQLTDFAVRRISPDGNGYAVLLPDLAHFSTSSRRHDTGWLSVALCMEL